MTHDEALRLKKLSAKIRVTALKLFKEKNGGHVGGSLSIIEALSVLYGKQMRYDPKNPSASDRDYLVLSKGHSGPGLYSALSVFGFFDEDLLFTLNEGGALLPSHPDRMKTPGVDATTGSLGQGISIATGIGCALSMEGRSRQYVYCIVGDGELNEGQCWEAFQFLAHYRLHNVIVLIDNNLRQLDGNTKDVMNPFNIAKKMEAFGFAVKEVPGNLEEEISDAIDWAKQIKDQAVCVILNTVKGQGVPYFENMPNNHSVKFKSEDIIELDRAITELERVYKGAV